MLINGLWMEDWHPVQGSDRQGRFLRQPSSIRNWITPRPQPSLKHDNCFVAEAGRYHLYVALICPWACRTLIARRLKKLEQVISLSIVSPVITPQGWQFDNFPGATPDHLFRAQYLHQIYTRHDDHYTGRATVPVLWDKKRDCMVNNESADILRILNDSFSEIGASGPDLYPADLRSQIDLLNEKLYVMLNNAVYQAGFATSQQAYEEAFRAVFTCLDEMETRLRSGGPFLLGKRLTETDIRLFVTLIRFDVAYCGLFKCNRRRIADYPCLSRYLADLYTLPEFCASVDFHHIKQGYYSIRQLNPSGIVPQGPELTFLAGAN